MKKPEWFPFYVGDFTSSSDVELMTTEAIGAFVMLMCKAWHQEPAGTLPDDDAALAKWARVKPARWKQIKADVLRAFKKDPDGRWHQKRMKIEADKFREISEQRRAAGKASAAKRATSVERPLNACSFPVERTGNEPVAVAVAVSVPDPDAREKRRVPDDEIDAIRTALVGVGFGAQEAIRLSGTPHLTLATLEWLIGKASTESVPKPKGYIAAGIRDGWSPDKPLAPEAGGEYKPPRAGRHE